MMMMLKIILYISERNHSPRSNVIGVIKLALPYLILTLSVLSILYSYTIYIPSISFPSLPQFPLVISPLCPLLR